jgi:hypothetical protein
MASSINNAASVTQLVCADDEAITLHDTGHLTTGCLTSRAGSRFAVSRLGYRRRGVDFELIVLSAARESQEADRAELSSKGLQATSAKHPCNALFHTSSP